MDNSVCPNWTQIDTPPKTRRGVVSQMQLLLQRGLQSSGEVDSGALGHIVQPGGNGQRLLDCPVVKESPVLHGVAGDEVYKFLISNGYIPKVGGGGNRRTGLLHFVQSQTENVASHFNRLAQRLPRSEAIRKIRKVDGVAAVLFRKNCRIYIFCHSKLLSISGAGITGSPQPA